MIFISQALQITYHKTFKIIKLKKEDKIIMQNSAKKFSYKIKLTCKISTQHTVKIYYIHDF